MMIKGFQNGLLLLATQHENKNWIPMDIHTDKHECAVNLREREKKTPN